MYKKSETSFWQPVCYIDTWKPIFYLSKLLGYAPISRNATEFYSSKTDITFSFAAFVLYASMFGMAFNSCSKNFYFPITDLQILDIGFNVSVLICNFTAVIIVLSNYINRYKICDISHAIQSIDDELIKLGFVMKYKRDLTVHIGQIVASVVGQIALYGFCVYLRKRYAIMNLPDALLFLYIGVTITYSIYMSNFIFVMVNIEKRYKAINQMLKKYFVKKPFALKSDLGHVCTKLAKLHDYLGDNVDAVNESLSIQVLLVKFMNDRTFI